MEFNPEAHLASLDLEATGRMLRERQMDIDLDALDISKLFEVVDSDGNERTFEDIKRENMEFFSRPEIVADLDRFNRAAALFAAQCQFHMHGQELANSMELGGIHNHGLEQLGDHPFGSHNHEDEKDKKTKSKNKYLGFFASRETAKRTGGVVFRILQPRK